jgi:hypothetical protein
MAPTEINKFFNNLQKAKKEEEVKNAYAKFFNLDYDTSDAHDLYTNRILFEFKADKNFDNVKTRSAILAQTLYYIRRLKYGGMIEKPIPPILCLADVNEAILTETALWKDFYDDTNEEFDWDLAPSNPDKKLVDAIANTTLAKDLHIYKVDIIDEFNVFSAQLSKYLNNQIIIDFEDKKVITESNFEEVFEYWNRIFGDAVRNGFKTSQYFVCDIQKGNTLFIKEESKVVFQFNAGNTRIKKILSKDYEHFWSLYEKVTHIDTIRSIIAKIDRLSDDVMRRFHGEFFTPTKFANKALDYIERTVGKDWYKTGEYRLWDMAAGTGNLEYHLPQDALQYSYLSTLYIEDKEYLDSLFPAATIFQYDYLNDDVANVFTDTNGFQFEKTWKLPEKLRNDLKNPKLKWIILINPPFATAQTAGTEMGTSKEGVADTKVRKEMHKNDLGEVSRELAMQFIYRIKKEFHDCETHFGLFYKIKHLNSNNDFKLRNTIFKFKYEKGFMFSSANFSGTSKASPFPVAFMIWNLKKEINLEKQKIVIDVFNDNVEKMGIKRIISEPKENHLSKWIKRPVAKNKFPPFGSALGVKTNNLDKRDRIATGFLASLMCKGNDFQNQNYTALLSGPYVSAGAMSVTPENFEQAMVVHAVRRIPKATWLNDRDQFLQPNKALAQDFINDCVVWSLFANSNNTVAMKNVLYEKETYQIRNHFFPFAVSEIKKWNITDSDIAITLATANDSFVCNYITNSKLSTEAKLVLDVAKTIYQFYFANLNQMRTNKYKVETYDAGFYQIKNCLKDVDLYKKELLDFNITLNKLRDKILPDLYEYGFINA